MTAVDHELTKKLRQRQTVEDALASTASSAELERKVIRGMEEALRILRECRTNLRKVALIVSLGAYRDVVRSISEAEAALKRAQANLTRIKKAENDDR